MATQLPQEEVAVAAVGAVMVLAAEAVEVVAPAAGSSAPQVSAQVPPIIFILLQPSPKPTTLGTDSPSEPK